jgi:hypothetical protein
MGSAGEAKRASDEWALTDDRSAACRCCANLAEIVRAARLFSGHYENPPSVQGHIHPSVQRRVAVFSV